MNRQMKIIKDCYCEHYLHEITNYPREGLVEKKLQEGDIVNLVKQWNNFYGEYYRVEKDGEEYDIATENIVIYDEKI